MIGMYYISLYNKAFDLSLSLSLSLSFSLSRVAGRKWIGTLISLACVLLESK